MANIKNNSIFRTLISGRFTHDQVLVNWTPEKQDFHPELSNKIDSFWQQEIVETGKIKYLFNGDLCRLNAWHVQKDKLTLDLGLSNYKELLYSNQCTGTHPLESGNVSLAKALGVSVVLISKDKEILLIKRSGAVGEDPGGLDVFGGHVHPRENARSGIPDPFLAIKAEIKEEAHLDLEEEILNCIGLIETVETKKPELLFKAKVGLIAKEIIKLASIKQSEEIAEFLTIPNKEKPLAQFLEANSNQISASAFGVLSVYSSTLI